MASLPQSLQNEKHPCKELLFMSAVAQTHVC